MSNFHHFSKHCINTLVNNLHKSAPCSAVIQIRQKPLVHLVQYRPALLNRKVRNVCVNHHRNQVQHVQSVLAQVYKRICSFSFEFLKLLRVLAAHAQDHRLVDPYWGDE